MRRSNWLIFRVVIGVAVHVAALMALSVPMQPLLAAAPGLNFSIGAYTVSTGTGSDIEPVRAPLGSGPVTVNVIAGGNMMSDFGYIGSDGGSRGTVTVSSSGTWASRDLVVGISGTGTLNVTGGSVTNVTGYIGNNAGSVGTATVSSGTWANSGSVYVGYSGNGTLNVTGGKVTNAAASIGNSAGSVGTATVSSGTWASSGNLTVGNSGTGTLTLTGGLVTVGGVLSQGASGTINLNSGGTLQIGVGSTGGVLLGGTGSLANNGALIFNRSNALTHSGVISGTGTVTKQGAGTLTLSGNNSYTGGTTINSGVLQVGAGGTTGSIAGNLVNNASLVFNRSDASNYSGVISSSGTLTKQGTGTLTLSGNNTYTGGTTISDGVLALGSANAVGTSGTISFGGGTLQYSASNTTDYSSRFSNSASQAYEIDTNGQNVTLASPLTSSGGTLTKSGSGTLTLSGNNSYTGGTNVAGGVLAVGGASALGTGTLVLNGGALSAAAGGVSFANAVSLNANTTIAGSDALTIGGNVTLNRYYALNITNSARTTISGVISETLGSILIKEGSGELELTGANSYTGGTYVQSGTVRINNTAGSAFGTGAVTVASGATLTGAGGMSGAVQMNGTWAPGNSPGLVTVNSNVVLGGSLDMELGGVLRATSGTGGTGYYDAMNVSNALTLGGTLNVALYNGFVPSYGNSFEILQYGQLSGDFGTVNYPALSGGLSWERTTSATAMTITVVPEPSTYAISAIATAGLASLMRWRKRRTRESEV